MKKRRQITISGKNWNDIIKLPCFHNLRKDRHGELRVELYYKFLGDMVIPGFGGGYAYVGDTLIEYANHKWEIRHGN